MSALHNSTGGEGQPAAPAPEPRRPLPWPAIVGALVASVFAYVMYRTFQAELAAERANHGRKPQPTSVILGLNDPATVRAREDEAVRMRTARSSMPPSSASAALTVSPSPSASQSQSQNAGDSSIARPSASAAAAPPAATPPATNTAPR